MLAIHAERRPSTGVLYRKAWDSLAIRILLVVSTDAMATSLLLVGPETIDTVTAMRKAMSARFFGRYRNEKGQRTRFCTELGLETVEVDSWVTLAVAE